MTRKTPGSEGAVRKGIGWSVINTITGRLGSIVSGMILARLLAPEDYGAYAVALVVLNAVLSFNELGVSLAIIRWRDDPGAVAPTVNLLSAASSMALYVVCFLAAPAIAGVLNAPAATNMIRVVCVCVLFDGFTASSAALIARDLQQGRRLVVDLVGFVLGSALSVILAIGGLGGWSMIWGLLLTSFMSGVTTIILAPRRFGFGFDRSVFLRLIRFGAPLAGASLLLFAMVNVDYVIVGHILGPYSLGLYLMAFNLSSWPVNIVSVTVRRVSLAMFARSVSDRSRLHSLFLRGMGAVLTCSIALCVPLAALSPAVLGVVYGNRWVPAATTLSLLCVFAVGRILAEYAYDYFIARDRNGFNLLLQGAWLLFLVPVLTVGARWGGIEGVGLGQALVVVVVVVPLLCVGLLQDYRTRDLLSAVFRPIATAVPVACLCVAVLHVAESPLVALAAGGVIGSLMYSVLNLPTIRMVRGPRGGLSAPRRLRTGPSA